METSYRELSRRLQLVEELIMTLEESDSFMEDLVVLHSQRNALIAAISNWRQEFATRKIMRLDARHRTGRRHHAAVGEFACPRLVGDAASVANQREVEPVEVFGATRLRARTRWRDEP